ncbi:fimbrial protein [Serratia aquatilis]|uniref:Fimbrial protein n=1 Tax=Serratia aquatilis TaxID=1737515 RepID=A0ABV6EFF0_9GAMM
MTAARENPKRGGNRVALPVLLYLSIQGITVPALAIDSYFYGTLVVPPPCELNSNAAIAVSFGNELLTGRVNGSNYEQPITYTLDCTGASSNALKLQFKGTGAGFDTTVLTTSKAALGLELRSNGAKLPMNTWFDFTYPARPVLTVVPVKATGSTLSGGPFTAASTLLVDYQ